MRLVWIIMDHGRLFEGTPEAFADCFFSNVNTESVLGYCEDYGFACELRYVP